MLLGKMGMMAPEVVTEAMALVVAAAMTTEVEEATMGAMIGPLEAVRKQRRRARRRKRKKKSRKERTRRQPMLQAP